MYREQAIEFLYKHNQLSLIDHIHHLNDKELHTFCANLQTIIEEDYFLKPAMEAPHYLEKDIHPLLQSQVTQGGRTSTTTDPNTKAAIFILAAGDGTRLGSAEPKALFPILGKSIIQHLFEKIIEIQKKSSFPIKIGLLLSKKNGPLVLNYLSKHHYFGVAQKQVQPIFQKDHVFVDEKGKWQLATPVDIAKGPSGNGEAVYAMQSSGFLNDFNDHDVIHLIPIDNPLALNSFYSISHIMQEKSIDLGLITFKRSDITEKLGLIVHYHDHPIILDYPSFPPTLYSNIEAFPYANTNIMGLRVSFLRSLQQVNLPFYTIVKKVKILKDNLLIEKELHRFERFITDIVAYADTTQFILQKRDAIYAAVKDTSSVNIVEQLLKSTQK